MTEAVLAGDEVERAWQVIEHVARALEDPPPPYEGKRDDPGLRVSLTRREPGYAVFYAHLHRVRPGRGYDELALHHLENAQAQMEHVAHRRPYFAFGFAGLAWAMEHVRQLLGVEDDPLEDIDAALLELVTDQVGTPRFAWRDGLAGYGVYALERGERGRELLAAILAALTASAEARPAGLGFRTLPGWLVVHEAEARPDGVLVTSMPDGAIGPLLLAGKAGARELHAGLLRWLLSCRGRDGRFMAYENGPALPSTCWFGGQLGLAASLLLVADLDDESRAELIELALASPRVLDESLADGHAGAAHLALRLWRRSGDARFLAAARRDLRAVLAAYDPALRFAFRFHIEGEDTRYVPELSEVRDDGGLVRGAAGTALALLGALHPETHTWDRAFLI